jgi:trehalose-6-phosphate synthase
MSPSKRNLSVTILLVAVLFGLTWNPSVAFAQSAFAQSYKELLERSEKEKKGLTFYVKGQTISGVVVKIGSDAVEVRNQTFSRIIIRLDSIDALAMN